MSQPPKGGFAPTNEHANVLLIFKKNPEAFLVTQHAFTSNEAKVSGSFLLTVSTDIKKRHLIDGTGPVIKLPPVRILLSKWRPLIV